MVRRRRPGFGLRSGFAYAFMVGLFCASCGVGSEGGESGFPLEPAGSIALPGDNSRFDYIGLDSSAKLMFIAHLGASEVVEVDTETRQVVRVIKGIGGVHGVLVVPALHRVFATATDEDQVITIDEETGEILGSAPTGGYPDGLAYDSRRNPSNAASRRGSASVADLRPPPGRRTRPSGAVPASSSATPSLIRDRDAPDARATAAIPP